MSIKIGNRVLGVLGVLEIGSTWRETDVRLGRLGGSSEDLDRASLASGCFRVLLEIVVLRLSVVPNVKE